MRVVYTILVGKAKGKRPFEAPKHVMELLKFILNISVSQRGTVSCFWERGPVAGSYEFCNDL
jgi:hypothetical protein